MLSLYRSSPQPRGLGDRPGSTESRLGPASAHLATPATYPTAARSHLAGTVPLAQTSAATLGDPRSGSHARAGVPASAHAGSVGSSHPGLCTYHRLSPRAGIGDHT